MVDLQAILLAGLGVISINCWIRAMTGRELSEYVGERWRRPFNETRLHVAWQGLTALQLGLIVSRDSVGLLRRLGATSCSKSPQPEADLFSAIHPIGGAAKNQIDQGVGDREHSS